MRGHTVCLRIDKAPLVMYGADECWVQQCHLMSSADAYAELLAATRKQKEGPSISSTKQAQIKAAEPAPKCLSKAAKPGKPSPQGIFCTNLKVARRIRRAVDILSFGLL